MSSVFGPKTFHHKNLARSIGAIASLSGALSVLVGMLAARLSPHGWGHVKMALHLTKKPLLMQLAPFIATFAVTAATVAGLLSFYSWYREWRDAQRAAGAPTPQSVSQAAPPSGPLSVPRDSLSPRNSLSPGDPVS
jgi:hypothetical protein